jgi:branched-chain amino acid transport system substrate-binding protein
LAAGSAANAQNATGVNDKGIVIGSCAALEGPSSFLGRETIAGGELYFQFVNDEGGINGRKLRLVSADDSFDPAKTEACWERMVCSQRKRLGMFGSQTIRLPSRK